MTAFDQLIPNFAGVLAQAAPGGSASASLTWAGWILWLPLLSMVLCGVCAALKVRTKLPAWITVVCLGLSFLVTASLYVVHDGSPISIHLFRWFDLHWQNDSGGFIANFALYIDSLTLLWMLFVTGLGTLIALYASEYMEPDVSKGYARFFAGISVFLFAMSALVMADNLVLLYLGWEGVGFASYWLIGYYYTKPSAVAAAKKAFIVNRIGDLGLALGIWFIYHNFGTVRYEELFAILDGAKPQAASAVIGGWSVSAIPFLLMLGAFGKSAQIPLYTWLPDAMEGPTPVSALIHAATMVTAGVYLLARMVPVMQLHPDALPTVAWIGASTALLAATIGMAQYDIKRIMAYSTVSQLGYMFAGIGFLTTYGAGYHVFTHAFFKAVLFLTCGAVMHGFAGQLDLRRISGLRKMPGWGVTSYTMLYACMCLAGVPLISSGFYSKDIIMAEAFVTHGPGFMWLGWILVLTAFLTAYYTFRVWFRVCAGPVHYEMGEEDHGAHEPEPHGGPDITRAEHEHKAETHGHKPHAPRWAINSVLLIITAGAVISIFLGGWVKGMVNGSSAAIHVEHHAGGGFFSDPHKWMQLLASIIGLLGIAVAWYFHLANRKAADAVRARLLANPATRWLPTAMEHKWYVDEFYDMIVRMPLWLISHVLNLFDRYIVDLAIIDGVARIPKWIGRSFQPLANGVLQSYAISMVGGLALAILLVVVVLPYLRPWLVAALGGGP